MRRRKTIKTVLSLFLAVSAGVALMSEATVAAADPSTGNCQYEGADEIYNKEWGCFRYGGFYEPPNPLPLGSSGDLIRSEPLPLVLEPSGQLGSFDATGTRIMYRSVDAVGKPIAITGTYFEPHNPWPGQGPRPLISYAAGTMGLGDQCAPSRLFEQGIHWSSGADITLNYEEGFIETLVARGFAVVMTDYQGFGTPGVHTFLNRLASGHAVIDAARAAKHLQGTSLSPQGPVAFMGYSQGGGAVASAAELASQYAPELQIVGTYAGAPPSDLKDLLRQQDGSVFVGAASYILNSIISAYPASEEWIRGKLNERGLQFLDSVKNQCVVETMLKYQFRHLQPFFVDNFPDILDEEPLSTLLEIQRIGSLKPNAPVLIVSNRYDPLVSWLGANQIGQDWCRQGAQVEFRTNEEPPFLNKLIVNHILTMFVDGEPSIQWLADRFNRVPFTGNCDNIENW